MFLTVLTGTLAHPEPAATPEWISAFIELAPTLHTCHGRRPGGVMACANPKCAKYNRASRLKDSLTWSADHPDHWRCEGCETMFPSPDYPENHVEVFDGLRFEYHLDPDGKRHYFTPVARWAKCYHALQTARSLGRAAARGDGHAAAQARDIVLAFAPVYTQSIYKLRGGRISYAGYPERCNWGRLGIFADYGWPVILCGLWRQLDEAGVMTDQQRQTYRGLVECMLENVTLPFSRQIRGLGNPMGQLWYDCVLAARTFPALRLRDLAFETEFGEQRILSAPDLIHDCVEGRFGVNNILANYFTSDGLCLERTPAYHAMTTTLLKRLFDAMDGYTDPPGYVPLNPEWRPFTDAAVFNTHAAARIYEILPRLTYPSGHWITVGDAQYLSGDFPPVTESEHHAGWGLSILRRGRGDAAMAALLSTGSSLDGHTHVDHQNIAFFARGHEQVTDIGYPVSGDRIQNTWWRGSAASHNTVIVDGRNQTRSHRGYLDAWADTALAAVAQHSDPGPYPTLDDYRRTLVLVGGNDGDRHPGYLLDIFHVIGGNLHDYHLHAQPPSDDDPEAVFSAEAIALDALDVPRSALELTAGAVAGEGYEHIQVSARGNTSDPYEVRWRTGDMPRTVLRCLRLPEHSEEVMIGRAPGYRDRHAGIHNSERKLTKLICRRTAATKLVSTFISVIEAHAERPAVRSARRLRVTGNDRAHPVALTIETNAGVDVVLVARQPGRASIEEKQIKTDARIAVVSFSPAGQVLAMMMVEGTSLQAGDRRLSCERPTISGNILDHPEGLATTTFNERNTGVLTDIPATDVRTGQRLFVDHGTQAPSTYIVRAITKIDARRSFLTLDRPCRERIGRLAAVSDNGLTLTPDTGLPRASAQPGGCRRFAGMWILLDDRWYRLRDDITDAYVLDTPVGSPRVGRGAPYIVTRLGPGDAIRIPALAAATFAETADSR